MKPTLETPASDGGWTRLAAGLTLMLSFGLTACGGGADDPGDRLPSANSIAATQAELDGTTVALTEPITEAQIVAAQAAVDGAAGSDPQASLDARAPTPAFAGQ